MPHEIARHTDFGHVILTRFNVRYEEDPKAPSLGLEPTWLAQRFELFDRYCLPSVLSQSEQDIHWILFFNSNTPEPFAQRARDLCAKHPKIHAIFCESVSPDLVKTTIQDLFEEKPPEWLLTTRLDNDDGINSEFVHSIQKAQSFGRAEVLNCRWGIILCEGRTYQHQDKSNAFISLSEPFRGFVSVFGILRHVYASESYPVRQVEGLAMWLQVIHANNISNRIRGRRIPLAKALSGFPFLKELVAQPEKKASIIAENLSLSALRSARDTTITIARRTAKLFGVDLRRRVSRIRN